MITDLDLSGLAELPEYDLCVVGSGPAGATLVRELRNSRPELRIAVLESGRERPSPLGDRLRRVVSEGINIRDDSRVRVLGGTSTVWAGLSAPLDPIDLEARPWAAGSGWPISYQELRTWYERAADGYGFPSPASFEPRSTEGGILHRRGGFTAELGPLDEKVFLAPDQPKNFGIDWTHAPQGAGADLWLDATLIELRAGDHPNRVGVGLVRSGSGKVHRIRAQVFVLAAGAIENARLLLLSRSSWPSGLGNMTDQVGRYMMNHPKGFGGLVRFRRPVPGLRYFFGPLEDGWSGYAGLRLNDSEQRSREILNSYIRLEPVLPGSGQAETSDPEDQGGDAVPRRDGRVGRTFRKLLARVRGSSGIHAARLRNFMEMEPDPANRVLLSDVTDEYGTPLPLVRHRPTERDRRSMIELHAVLGAELARNGIGRLEDPLDQREPWPITQDASHHLGTTRMGTDPASSVVNPDLRLHDIENVFLAGGSVFPTGGCANPTYTIVALSIRLADHLDRNGFVVLCRPHE